MRKYAVLRWYDDVELCAILWPAALLGGAGQIKDTADALRAVIDFLTDPYEIDRIRTVTKCFFRS